MSREKLVDGNFFLKNTEEQQWVSPAEHKNSELNSNCPVVWIATLASCAVWEQGMENVVMGKVLYPGCSYSQDTHSFIPGMKLERFHSSCLLF